MTDSQFDNLCMFVRDVLRHDVIEQLSSILNLINNDGGVGWRDQWPRDFESQEVIRALRRLVALGDVVVVRVRTDRGGYDDDLDADPETFPIDENTWFHLTPRGWASLEQWTPPPDSN